MFERKRKHAQSFPEKKFVLQVAGMSEFQLLTALYDGRTPIQQATPQGYEYQPISQLSETVVSPIRVGYVGPHPSDFADFMGGTALRLHSAKTYELLATEGERGSTHHPMITRRIRRSEARNSANLLANSLEVLRTKKGKVLPDAKLMSHLPQLTEIITNKLSASSFDVIVIPSPAIDHPDHVAVHIATIWALVNLAKQANPVRILPAVYSTDPEYGYGSGGHWAEEKVHAVIPDYPYLAGMTEFTVPQYIVDISKTFQRAHDALLLHRSQMKGKKYALNIPALKRIRGMQVGSQWAEGLSQIVIPGVTASHNILADHLPQNSMFTVAKSKEALPLQM